MVATAVSLVVRENDVGDATDAGSVVVLPPPPVLTKLPFALAVEWLDADDTRPPPLSSGSCPNAATSSDSSCRGTTASQGVVVSPEVRPPPDDGADGSLMASTLHRRRSSDMPS